jgi:hypothetical protein
MLRRRHIRAPLPLALSLVAVALALVGVVTNRGEAASPTVRAANFATEAHTISGLRVSHRPRAGQILVLDADGRYPRSVIPPTVGDSGPRGAQGPRGADGPPGQAGGELVFTRRTKETIVSRFAGDGSTLAELEDLPSGSWLLLSQFSSGANGTAAPMSCALTHRNVVLSSTRTMIGRGPGGLRFGSGLTVAGWSSDVASTPRLDCALEAESFAGDVTVARVWLGAIRVGSLDIRRQAP